MSEPARPTATPPASHPPPYDPTTPEPTEIGTVESEPPRQRHGVRAAFHRVADGYRRFRARVARNRTADLAYRIGVGVVGVAIVVVGIVALPAPGPGWAIIFIGLGVLATEFERAHRILVWVRRHYDAWVAWMGRQNRVVQLLVSTAILLVVALCAWLIGAFATVGGWFGIEWYWLQSPLRGVL